MTENMAEEPSAETIAYGRRVITEVCDKYRRFAEEAETDENRKRWYYVVEVLQFEFLGNGGCVIAPFDERRITAIHRDEQDHT